MSVSGLTCASCSLSDCTNSTPLTLVIILLYYLPYPIIFPFSVISPFFNHPSNYHNCNFILYLSINHVPIDEYQCRDEFELGGVNQLQEYDLINNTPKTHKKKKKEREEGAKGIAIVSKMGNLCRYSLVENNIFDNGRYEMERIMKMNGRR